MTLIERLEKIVQLTEELKQMTVDLHADITEAVANPESILDTNEIEHVPDGDFAEDPKREDGGES